MLCGALYPEWIQLVRAEQYILIAFQGCGRWMMLMSVMSFYTVVLPEII